MSPADTTNNAPPPKRKFQPGELAIHRPRPTGPRPSKAKLAKLSRGFEQSSNDLKVRCDLLQALRRPEASCWGKRELAIDLAVQNYEDALDTYTAADALLREAMQDDAIWRFWD